MARERDPSREVFWRRVLRRRTVGGMTIAEFCVSEGLTTAAYHYWQREVKRLDTESQSQDAVAAVRAGAVIDDRHGEAPVEVVTGSGYVIRVAYSPTRIT